MTRDSRTTKIALAPGTAGEAARPEAAEEQAALCHKHGQEKILPDHARAGNRSICKRAAAPQIRRVRR